jgi:hypothetical protein
LLVVSRHLGEDCLISMSRVFKLLFEWWLQPHKMMDSNTDWQVSTSLCCSQYAMWVHKRV